MLLDADIQAITRDCYSLSGRMARAAPIMGAGSLGDPTAMNGPKYMK
jgi:hypothetical protein